MKLTQAVGIRIENLLKERGWTQYELSKRGGIPRATICKLVHPDLSAYKTCKMGTVYDIASTFGLSLSEFFNDPIFSDLED